MVDQLDKVKYVTTFWSHWLERFDQEWAGYVFNNREDAAKLVVWLAERNIGNECLQTKQQQMVDLAALSILAPLVVQAMNKGFLTDKVINRMYQQVKEMP